MLEARLSEASVLKKLLDSIKELVTDANFECNDEGISLQAMDNSHVALVAVMLRADAFSKYRCDRSMPLGVSLPSLTKVLKCAKDDDIITLKASDDADSLGLIFESAKADRLGEYEIKLMDIDQEHMGIPDTVYDASVTMSSSEFQRICRDLTSLGESVKIDATKDGIRFSSEGDIGSASVLLKAASSSSGAKAKVKKERTASASPKKAAAGGKKVKKEKVKKEEGEDEDEDMEGKEVLFFPDAEEVSDDDEVEEEEAADEEEEEEEEEEAPKKKKRPAAKAATGGKAKKSKKGGDEGEDLGVVITLQQAVTLTFSLKYLLNFAKSAPLASRVSLSMSNEVPLLVGFEFEQGYINYFLAPKIGDSD